MKSKRLSDLYLDPRRIVVTAHRGFSAKYPENTIPAFIAAVESGADIIEFDLRGTRDRIPVVLHDPHLQHTSDGSGNVGDYSLTQLKEMDFSYHWKQGGNDPLLLGSTTRVPIPTFEESLQAIPESVGLNIQVKETEAHLVGTICGLFDSYDLYKRAYLTVSTFPDAAAVRGMNPKIDLCVLERKFPLDYTMLQRMKEFGCRFLQPHRRDVTSQLCRRIREMGFWANLFYSNTDQDNRRFIGYGIQGILTDAPDILIHTIRDLGLPFS
ncbi:MAG: glycerophosphodiester phosphodiesterase family protein [Spirochaetia bacterium]